jgi:AcrR family transcriptional regulator
MNGNVDAGTDEDPSGSARPRVRDRIFDSACELFYNHGIRGVCVDAIAADAGTNKMSFYRNFHSKDELVAQYLHEREREFWEFWDAAIAKYAGDPRRQIEALFEAHVNSVEDKVCRGCALGNAAVEMSDENDHLSALVRSYKEKVRTRLRQLASAAGARDAEALGDMLMLLMDGAYFTRLVFPGKTGPVKALLAAVRAVMDDQLAHRPASG